MKSLYRLLAATLAFFVPLAQACDLTLEAGWVRAAPPVASMWAGYGVLRNAGAAPLEIRALASPQFAAVELHEVIHENDVARMRKIAEPVVPAHGELRLAPGGLHLMLMHPNGDLHAGGHVDLVVEACTEPLRVRLPIREGAPDGEAADDHAHHHH